MRKYLSSLGSSFYREKEELKRAKDLSVKSFKDCYKEVLETGVSVVVGGA